jgi:hypothetical protein
MIHRSGVFLEKLIFVETSGSHGSNHENDGSSVTLQRVVISLMIETVRPPKRPSVSTRLHGATSQKTAIFMS